MNQCVPNWDLDDNPNLIRRSHSNSLSLTPNDPELDYEVAELTWENGQLSMHGLGPRRVPSKSQAISPHAKYYLDKPRAAGGTLESIVDQATFFTPYETTTDSSLGGGISTGAEFVPWLNHQRSITRPTSATMAIASAATMTMDALVPCTNNNSNKNKKEAASMHVGESGVGTYGVGCSTRVESVEKGRVTRAAAAPYEWSNCRDQSVTGSATFSRQLTLDPCDKEFGVGGFTSTSVGSLGNTSSGKQLTGDDHDSACHCRPLIRVAGHEEAKTKESGKSSISTKRSRAAAVHNQSERKRRDKINQRMKTLQKLVPNSNKTDKASMLDEVIEYLKQLQGQVNVISRMNMSPMMLPLTMQQQLQMSMMAPMMGMGMGMGMGVMDINGGSMTDRPIIAGMPPVLNPAAFMSPLASGDQGTADRLQPSSSVIPDSMSTFPVACLQQPMTMDAYSRMAAMYQRLQQNPGPGAKN